MTFYIYLIYLTLPALFSLLVRVISKKQQSTTQAVLADYTALFFIINLCMRIFTWLWGIHNTLYLSISVSTRFAYLLIAASCFLGILLSTLEILSKKNIDDTALVKLLFRFYALPERDLWILCIALIIINLLRCFNIEFITDETFSIAITRRSIPDLLQATANDVHPPLYYLILKFMFTCFGRNTFTARFTSMIPYILYLIFIMKPFRRQFGNTSAFLMIIFGSLLASSAKYIVQARMYSWCALFVVLTYWSLLKVYHGGTLKDYLFLSLFSILTAYTHYYGLILVSLIYVILLIRAMFKKHDAIKNTLISSALSLICYAPWIAVLLTTVRRVTGDWWAKGYPGVMECLLYLFDGMLSPLLLVLFIIFILWAASKKSTKDKSYLPWFYTGIFAVIGTLAIGEAYSFIVRPVLIDRFLFPPSTICWMIFSICIADINIKDIWQLILCALITVTGIFNLYQLWITETQTTPFIQKTLELTKGLLSAGDVVLVDDWNTYSSTMISFYYPGVSMELINFDTFDYNELDPNTHYFILDTELLSDKQLSHIQSAGYRCDLKLNEENGYLSGNSYNYYELTKTD